jgi:hypothetical protein
LSGSKQITVTRDYEYDADACARALELLLKTTVSKKGHPPRCP